MNIQRFSAPDMRQAMGRIRDELGPDAVILETVKTAAGVEVSAAIDFDPAQYAKSQRQTTSREAGAAQSRPSTTDAPRAPQAYQQERRPVASPDPFAARPAPRAPAPPASPGPETTGRSFSTDDAPPAKARVSNEEGAVRCQLEARLSRLLWDDMRNRNPSAANVMRNFARLGLTPDVIERLLLRAGDISSLQNSWTEPLKWLTDSIPVATDDLIMRGGVYAIAGPTGVGKTTSVAKLAARYALRNGIEDIALVSTDNYRIGAREQLETFARILGVPVYSVADPGRLDATLAGLTDKRLVLIDTAGMGQRDVRMVEQLSTLRRSDADIAVLLAIPANLQTETLLEIINVFEASEPVGCILTKVDETTSLGGVLSGLIRADLPLAYICNGQRVPEDVHLAVQRMSWLVKVALDCMRIHAPRVSKDEMAERFIQVAING